MTGNKCLECPQTLHKAALASSWTPLKNDVKINIGIGIAFSYYLVQNAKKLFHSLLNPFQAGKYRNFFYKDDGSNSLLSTIVNFMKVLYAVQVLKIYQINQKSTPKKSNLTFYKYCFKKKMFTFIWFSNKLNIALLLERETILQQISIQIEK